MQRNNGAAAVRSRFETAQLIGYIKLERSQPSNGNETDKLFDKL